MFTSTTPAHGRRSEKHKEVATGSGFFVFEGLEFRGLGLRALGFRVLYVLGFRGSESFVSPRNGIPMLKSALCDYSRCSRLSAVNICAPH